MTKLVQPNVLRTYQSGELYAANEMVLYNGVPAYTNTTLAQGVAGTAGNFTNLSSNTYSDSLFRIQDNNDATKQIAFQASGIATGQERTITMPNANVDLTNVASPASPSANGYLTPSDFVAIPKKVYITSTYTISGNDVGRDHEFILTSNANLHIQNLSTSNRIVCRSGDGGTYTISNAAVAAWGIVPVGTPVQVSQTQEVIISGNIGSSHVGYITGSVANTSHFQIKGTGSATFNIPLAGSSVITVPNYNVSLGNIPFLNMDAVSPITNGGINYLMIAPGSFGLTIPITYASTLANTKFIVYNNTVSNQSIALNITWSGQTGGFSATPTIRYSDQSATTLSAISGVSGTYNTGNVIYVPPAGSIELVVYANSGGTCIINAGICTNTGGLSTSNQWLKMYKSYSNTDLAKYMWINGSALNGQRELTLPDTNVDLGLIPGIGKFGSNTVSNGGAIVASGATASVADGTVILDGKSIITGYNYTSKGSVVIQGSNGTDSYNRPAVINTLLSDSSYLQQASNPLSINGAGELPFAHSPALAAYRLLGGGNNQIAIHTLTFAGTVSNASGFLGYIAGQRRIVVSRNDNTDTYTIVSTQTIGADTATGITGFTVTISLVADRLSIVFDQTPITNPAKLIHAELHTVINSLG